MVRLWHRAAERVCPRLRNCVSQIAYGDFLRLTARQQLHSRLSLPPVTDPCRRYHQKSSHLELRAESSAVHNQRRCSSELTGRRFSATTDQDFTTPSDAAA